MCCDIAILTHYYGDVLVAIFRPEEVFKDEVPDFLTFFFLISKSASLAFTNSGAKSTDWSALTGVGCTGCIGADGTFGDIHMLLF
jgi:hypothetical protein